MEIFIAITVIIIGYLAGSISSAIIITHLVTGQDIRSLGNQNAGTANVGRSIGKGYAAIVFLVDVSKAVLSMLLARTVLTGGEATTHFIVILVGLAAILGHCKPIYFRFKGGGGIATTFGAIGFVTPFELFIAMVAGFLLVKLLISTKEYRLGRWTSGVIVMLIPVIVTLSTVLLDIHVAGAYRLGGHSWYVVAGTWITIVFAILMNARLFGSYIAGLFRTS